MIKQLCSAMLLCAVPAIALAQIGATTVVTKVGPDGKVTETDATTSVGTAATQAQINLATAVVPGSGIAPATTLSSGAGTEETALLESVVVREGIGQLIDSDFLSQAKGVLVVAASTQTTDASGWRSFKDQESLLHQALRDDMDGLEKLDSAQQTRKQQLRYYAAGALAVAIPVAQKVLSYFNTTYSAGGVALASDDYLAEVQILSTKSNWKILGQSGSVDLQPVDDLLSELRNDVREAKAKLAAVKKGVDPKDPAAAAAVSASDDAVTADTKSVTDFVTAAQVPATMAGLVQSEVYSAALEPGGGGVLYLRMHSASGGSLTRTTFWSNLGMGMPISNSIDVKFSYVFYRYTAAVAPATAPVMERHAGIFDSATRNYRADKVLDFVIAYTNGECAAAKRAQSKYKDVCPVVIGLPITR